MTKLQWNLVSMQSVSHALCSGHLALVPRPPPPCPGSETHQNSSPWPSHNLYQMLISFCLIFLFVDQTSNIQTKQTIGRTISFSAQFQKLQSLVTLGFWAQSWKEQYSDGVVWRMSWQIGSK